MNPQVEDVCPNCGKGKMRPTGWRIKQEPVGQATEFECDKCGYIINASDV